MKTKKDIYVYIINSFCNGGAERVVATEANYLAETGKSVYIITFQNYNAYKLHPNVKIIALSKQEKLSKFQKILYAPYLVIKLNKILKRINKECNIKLLTSHLPYSHLITRLSKYRNTSLFVFHNPHYQFKYSKKNWFKLLLKFAYNNKKLISVSDGVKEELINIYNIKSKYIKTIYNPINMTEIKNKLNEENCVDEKDKYIIFCGRLSPQKNPHRMLEVFYKGKFYKKYKLVILGVGELEKDIRSKISGYKLENRVVLKGWQSNAYQWIKNAELLVCTSDYESFGMVIAEALACNTKVVSVDCKYGPNEILIDELSKYLSTFATEDIINKINLALTSYPKKLANYVEKFDIKNNLNNYIKIFEEWS